MESGIQLRSSSPAVAVEEGPCLRRSLRISESPNTIPLKDLSLNQKSLPKIPTSEKLESTDIKHANNSCRSSTSKRCASPHEKEPKKKRKSGRRSSFVRGRITEPGLGFDLNLSSDLSKGLPPDLTGDERLKRIVSSAIEFTLGKVRTEFPDVDGIQQLQVKAMHESVNLMDSMKELGLFTKAVITKSPPKEGSTASLVDDIIAKANRECSVLKAELEAWDAVVEKSESRCQFAKEEFKQLKLNPITPPPPGISVDGLDVLENRPDYNAIMAEAQSHLDGLPLFSEELQNGVKIIKRFLNHVDERLKLQANDIGNKAFAGIEGFHDPKTMIAKISDPSS